MNDEYKKHLEAVKQFGRVLEYVPKPLRDKEICIEAMKKYNYAFEHVPVHLKGIIKALKTNEWKEPHLDVEEKNPEFQCCVCFVNKKCVMFEKCKHNDFCFSCSKKLRRKCPLCRMENQDTSVVYI